MLWPRQIQSERSARIHADTTPLLQRNHSNVWDTHIQSDPLQMTVQTIVTKDLICLQSEHGHCIALIVACPEKQSDCLFGVCMLTFLCLFGLCVLTFLCLFGLCTLTFLFPFSLIFLSFLVLSLPSSCVRIWPSPHRRVAHLA